MRTKNSGNVLTTNGPLEVLCESLDREFGGGQTDFTKYQDDPVGFGEEILGETYTDDVKVLMESIRS